MIFWSLKYHPLQLHIELSLILLWCNTEATTLSLSEKVGQILAAQLPTETAHSTSMKALNKLNIGTIILYPWANNLKNRTSIQQLCQHLHLQVSQTYQICPF